MTELTRSGRGSLAIAAGGLVNFQVHVLKRQHWPASKLQRQTP